MSNKTLKVVDARGRVAIGSTYANQLVEIEEIDGKLIIVKVEALPQDDLEAFKKWKEARKEPS